jgi:hypothetical protein
VAAVRSDVPSTVALVDVLVGLGTLVFAVFTAVLAYATWRMAQAAGRQVGLARTHVERAHRPELPDPDMRPRERSIPGPAHLVRARIVEPLINGREAAPSAPADPGLAASGRSEAVSARGRRCRS